MDYNAQHHVTILGKHEDAILTLPAIFTAVADFYDQPADKFLISEADQKFAVSVSKVSRECYMMMAGQAGAEGGEKISAVDSGARRVSVSELLKKILTLDGKILCFSKLLAKKWKHSGATISKQNLLDAGAEAQSIGAGSLVEFNSGKGQSTFALQKNETIGTVVLVSLGISLQKWQQAFHTAPNLYEPCDSAIFVSLPLDQLKKSMPNQAN